MASESASDPTCTCPSGDGSLRWPCPKHSPAAAQEAVAISRAAVEGAMIEAGAQQKKPSLWTVTTRELVQVVNALHAAAPTATAPTAAVPEAVGEVAEWEGTPCVQWVPNYEPPVGTQLFAAPVTAAPAIDPSRLGAAMSAFDAAGGHAVRYAPEWMRKALEAASTPAAPGIDLVSDILTDLSNVADSWVVEAAGTSADAQNECASQMHDAIERWSNRLRLSDSSPMGVTAMCEVEAAALQRALAEYPGRNTHQLQARKVCAGVIALAKSYGSQVQDSDAYVTLQRVDVARLLARDEHSPGYALARRRIADAMLPQASGTEECAHNWVDARNQVVKSGEFCTRCEKVRASDAEVRNG